MGKSWASSRFHVVWKHAVGTLLAGLLIAAPAVSVAAAPSSPDPQELTEDRDLGKAPADPRGQGDDVEVDRILLMEGSRHETPLTVIKAPKSGPTVMLVGGLHGHDPAGVEAAARMTEFRDLERGTLLVLPELNREAVEAGVRHTGVDLNRAFPVSAGMSPSDPRAAAVWDTLQTYEVDYLIDMHEGTRPWTESDYLGNLIIYQRTDENESLVSAMLDALNDGVDAGQSWREGGIPIQGGLTRAAQDWLNVGSFYVSTARSNPLSLRVRQHLQAAETLLASLGMITAGVVESSKSEEPQEPREGSDASVEVRTLLPGTPHATQLYVIDSGRPGPTVWISGGVHGSELAGWRAAEQIAKWRPSRGRLIVLPHANKVGVERREYAPSPYGNLNRQFPTSSGSRPSSRLAAAIWQELQRYRPDWVMDLHEAMSNRNLNPNSVGQTIIAYPSGEMESMAQAIIRGINPGLRSELRFRMLRYPVQGSLARAAGQFLGANASIVETSRLYDLNDRISWHLRMMELLLKELHMDPIRTASSAGPASDPTSVAA